MEALRSGANNGIFSKGCICELRKAKSVGRCIQNLKLGKALRPDGLNVKHLRYAYPTIAVHICALFRSIILHGYVPKDFGSGIVIPLIKNKTGDVNNVNNYSGKELSPVISKLFEFVLLEICEHFLICDELNLDLKEELDIQKQFLHCVVQLIILRINASPYL